MNDVLEEVVVTMDHARTFITSRQKMNETGVELYDELLERLRIILITRNMKKEAP